MLVTALSTPFIVVMAGNEGADLTGLGAFVIASGGAGALEHFAPAVAAGADAVLAASVFHSGQLTVGQVKDAMAAEGIEVRR